MHIKKGDNVIVITGADKGKKGAVLKSFPTIGKVIVDGVNMKKKAVKARGKKTQGGIVSIAMPIDASNVKKNK